MERTIAPRRSLPLSVRGSVISCAWLQHRGLPTDGSADLTDPDADGHNNWQAWRCQTDPINPLSALRLLTAARTGTNVVVTWQSVASVTYFLERSIRLPANPPFSPLTTGIPSQPGTTNYTDANAVAAGPISYRVGIRPLEEKKAGTAAASKGKERSDHLSGKRRLEYRTTLRSGLPWL